MKFGILLSLILTFAMPVWAADQATNETTEVSATTTAASDSQAGEKTADAKSALAQEKVAAPTLEKAKAEDEIPVDFSKVKKAESTESSTGRLFLTFGIMAVFLGLGYYFAKKYGRPRNSPKTNIKVLTQHYLGPKKSLAIVRVAGESILIGVTDHNISMLKSLSLLDDEIPENVTGASFQETFNEKKELSMDKLASGPTTSKENSKEHGEEFSIRHIKDVVSLKLKGMRNEL